jgi:hypothetical protein
MDLLPTPTPPNAGSVFSGPHTGSPDTLVFGRTEIQVKVAGAGLSYAEWKLFAELGDDFEAIVDHVYRGEPLPFALAAVPALRSSSWRREAQTG